MSDKKTIQINPELFKVSSSGRSKKRKTDPNAPDKEIRVRKPKNVSIKKSITNLIRARQEKMLKAKAESENSTQNEKKKPTETPSDTFNNEFEESLKYLTALVKENDEKKKEQNISNKNHTIKQKYPSFHPDPIVSENVSLEFPEAVKDIANPFSILPRFPAPFHGCLKGGTLPTFRQWNKTQKNHYPPHSTQLVNRPNTYEAPAMIQEPQQHTTKPNVLTEQQKIQEIGKQIVTHKLKQEKRGINPRLKNKKQRRVSRRTFRVGRSKVHPRISVLISNKTIRNNITTKSQLLQQTPIQDVKKYLIKQGFIKVGTVAPNDVLRKMYESSMLLCGEVQNHNPENLLYNYFNSDNVL
jgi:hypothetical protein